MVTRKILYIEDDEGDIDLMRRGVDAAKFEVIGEIYGDRAISKLEADIADQTIKAVLLDAVDLKDPVTGLPQSLQADEIALKIKEIRPGLPVFAVSWFRRGGLSVPVDGVYPKTTLFTTPATFKDLEEALSDAILKMEVTSFYPDDGGGTSWRDRWGPKYIEFRNSANFHSEQITIGRRARQDYDLLVNASIGGTYRKYRGPDNLKNLLIVRRVIFATVFSCYGSDKGVVWREVSEFLGFEFPKDEEPSGGEMQGGLRTLMSDCGIKWGNIINRATLLREEEEWLREESFLTF